MINDNEISRNIKTNYFFLGLWTLHISESEKENKTNTNYKLLSN